MEQDTCYNCTKKQLDVMELFTNTKLVKICAPMVRYSKLPFRNLVKDYDCDLFFTPMILADSFCKSDKARNNEFSTNLYDQPLITQFAANTVHDFVGAAYMISPFCNGVDLNCGCPQRWAKQMGIGCIMLEEPQLIYDIVRQCRNTIAKPFTISVKMRLKQNLRQTIEICKQLEHCGVSFLTVHGRTPNQNTGPINEESLKLIATNLNIPLVANGAVKTLNDSFDLQEKTNCKGVMVANGLLTNPTLFTGTSITPIQCVQKWLNLCKIDDVTFQCFHHHLVFMLEKILTKAQKRIFNNLQSYSDVIDFLQNAFGILPQPSETVLSKIKINYNNRDETYLRLKPQQSENIDFCFNYSNSGKFFENKVNDTCDWSNIFLEND